MMQHQIAVLVATIAIALLVRAGHAEVCEPCPPRQVLEIREVTVCELDQKTLSCPSGTAIQIHDAFYGRRNTYTCRHQVTKHSYLMCTSPMALSVIKNRCGGKSECDLTSANHWFADPCKGTYKYLEVSYSCA